MRAPATTPFVLPAQSTTLLSSWVLEMTASPPVPEQTLTLKEMLEMIISNSKINRLMFASIQARMQTQLFFRVLLEPVQI